MNYRRLMLLAVGSLILAGLAGLAVVRSGAQPPARDRQFTLTAAPMTVRLSSGQEVPGWAYNGRIPGPEIRVRQGERLEITVENGLDEETTVHWHGVRVPHAMDGVPHLTQPPIAPGESFVYEFDCPDAGTFWYHPHHRSFEQAGRGLSGPVVVEEKEPIQVDRDVTWVLDDWRLLQDAAIRDDFGNLHDVSHAGRLGNTVTVNGRVPETFPVRAGERVRLRLVNVANARIFGLTFEDHEPTVIAYDGQPVEPHRPAAGRILLGPAMRADVVIDMSGRPNERFTVVDRFYQGREYRLLDLVYDAEPLRDRPLEAPIRFELARAYLAYAASSMDTGEAQASRRIARQRAIPAIVDLDGRVRDLSGGLSDADARTSEQAIDPRAIEMRERIAME